MHVKFEVHRFNRFKLVWLTDPLCTHRHALNEYSISAIHSVHLAEIKMSSWHGQEYDMFYLSREHDWFKIDLPEYLFPSASDVDASVVDTDAIREVCEVKLALVYWRRLSLCWTGLSNSLNTLPRKLSKTLKTANSTALPLEPTENAFTCLYCIT